MSPNIPTTKQLEKLLKLRREYETYKYKIQFQLFYTPIRRQIFYLFPNGAAPLSRLWKGWSAFDPP